MQIDPGKMSMVALYKLAQIGPNNRGVIDSKMAKTELDCPNSSAGTSLAIIDLMAM